MVLVLLAGILVAAVWTATLVAGAMLTWRGWHGKEKDRDPRCRRCGYNLSGWLLLPRRCTECGASLDGPEQMRFGDRAHDEFHLAIGVGLLIVALAPPLLAVVQRGTWKPARVAAVVAPANLPRSTFPWFAPSRLSARPYVAPGSTAGLGGAVVGAVPSLGAVWAPSPPEVFSLADAVVPASSHPEAAASVAIGLEALLSGAPTDRTWFSPRTVEFEILADVDWPFVSRSEALFRSRETVDWAPWSMRTVQPWEGRARPADGPWTVQGLRERPPVLRRGAEIRPSLTGGGLR